MKKFLKNIILILTLFTLVSCTGKGNVNKVNINEIKEKIDYVLSYENGYDDNMKKYITEDNFYIANYVEFYSVYLGEMIMKEYKSEIINFEESGDDLIKVYMKIDMIAASKEIHLHEEKDDHNNEVNENDESEHSNEEELRDEAIGEDVPVEIIVKFENGNYVIKSFTEYESLDIAKELNKGFNN